MTLSALDISTAKIVNTVPINPQATSIVLSPDGATLLVGYGSGTDGSVELRSAESGALETTIPLPGPVVAVSFGASSTGAYALCKVGSASVIVYVTLATGKLIRQWGVAADAVGMAYNRSLETLYLLESNGSIDGYPEGATAEQTAFPVNATAVALCLDSSGNIMYVLTTTGGIDSLAVVDVSTESILHVYAAAADSVALAPSTSHTLVYDVVGTPSVGNVQAVNV